MNTKTPNWVDGFGRSVTYLRISVTERCNFRCVYCMPELGSPGAPNPALLTYKEIAQVVRVFARHGVKKLRLTGGEPLVRRELHKLVSLLKDIDGIEHVAMTTNAFLLSKQAVELKEAGLDALNISLDSLDPHRFARLTRTGRLDRVIAAIDHARHIGLSDIKLNAVIVRGFNDDELVELIRFSADRGMIMRFIEFMPIGSETLWGKSGAQSCVSANEMRTHIGAHFTIKHDPSVYGAGPARYFRVFGQGLPSSGHPVGIISAVTECFCADCNRVRLTAKGGLRACLADDHEMDLKTTLRQYDNHIVCTAMLEAQIKECLMSKKESHAFDLHAPGVTLKAMNAIGG